jgi:hypothetical protein
MMLFMPWLLSGGEMLLLHQSKNNAWRGRAARARGKGEIGFLAVSWSSKTEDLTG